MTSVGMAAGIAAAFNAPIAAVTFTLEELIGDLDQTMLSGVIVAAALAAVVEHSDLGRQPDLSCAACLSSWPTPLRWSGMLCSVCWPRLSRCVHRFPAWIARVVQAASRGSEWVHPALGGAATGGFAVVAIWVFH